ncbi:AbrB/MazE/SpoVT family DNA-binding domain-containing protein [Gloeocapsopsis crepidinum]|nr:hypothetical protein [Gloeocapsopsis crepidinum]
MRFPVVDGGIMIQLQRKKYTLEELLEGMTPDNFHSETDIETPVGNEVW